MNSLSDNRRPKIIGIGGFTSEVGKTTLLCKLLSAFPGWEAIKTTRGHYRSCGKDPHMCCVSDLLSEEPVIRSGRESTYAAGKDTGKYWEAGASNVHWVIATNEQVEAGINEALGRVKADGVFIEGNSFTEFVKPDFFLMVARADQTKIKPTAHRAFKDVSVIYLSGSADGDHSVSMLSKILPNGTLCPPVFSADELPQLIELLRANFGVAIASEGKNIMTVPHLRPA
jgi:molybdopterin-guanine dinucleotide biosynthesis protein